VNLILLLLVIAGSMIFNRGYSVIDHLFKITSQEDVNFINPEIFDPSVIFRSININPEMLFGFILFFILIFGTHIFITSMKNVKELEVIAARQKKESITAQYEALKNQIDPHSLQMLVENAVKHNTFKKENQLIIEITEDDDYIIIRNNKNKRRLLQESTGIGLQNIHNRVTRPASCRHSTD
jgi:hypothetical protein